MRLTFALLALALFSGASFALELHVGITKQQSLTLNGKDVTLDYLRAKVDAAKSNNEKISIVIGGYKHDEAKLKEILGELEEFVVPNEPSILILQSDVKH